MLNADSGLVAFSTTLPFDKAILFNYFILKNKQCNFIKLRDNRGDSKLYQHVIFIVELIFSTYLPYVILQLNT